MDVNRISNKQDSQTASSNAIKPVNSAVNSFNQQLKHNGGNGDNLDKATSLGVADMSGRISQQDLSEGKQAMDGMMNIVREAASATGAAADGSFSQQEVLGMNSWIRENRLQEWTALHGDDEGNSETGFHKWQGDGGKFNYNGDKYVNTVLDGINHLGFEFDGKNFKNEDGDANANLSDMTDWLNTAYFGDFAPGMTIAQGGNGGGDAGAAGNAGEAGPTGAEQAAAPEQQAAAPEQSAPEQSAAPEQAAANEMSAPEQASGFSILDDVNSFPTWLELLAQILGISPEELKAILQDVMNEDGTIDKEKLAAKLEEKGMDPEMAQAVAGKMADAFDKLTAEGGELEGLSKDEIIAKVDSANLEGASAEEKSGISALIAEMVKESAANGGNYNPQNVEAGMGADTAMNNSLAGILQAQGYEQELANLYQRASL